MRALKDYKALSTRKGREESGMFMAEGERAIRLIIDTQPGSIVEILCTEAFAGLASGFPVRFLSEKQYRQISPLQNPQGVGVVLRIPPEVSLSSLPQDPGESVVLLEDIQDPGNVGTLVRTAAAFGFSGAVLSEHSADPFSPKAVQASAGTLLNLWIRRTASYLELCDALKELGYQLVGTALKGEERTDVLLHADKLLLALGNEGSGLTKALTEKCGITIKLPMRSGTAESLNVALTGGICMYLRSQGRTGNKEIRHKSSGN